MSNAACSAPSGDTTRPGLFASNHQWERVRFTFMFLKRSLFQPDDWRRVRTREPQQKYRSGVKPKDALDTGLNTQPQEAELR